MARIVYYADLATECQIARGSRVRAVGWLAVGREFARGEVDDDVVDALRRLTEDGWVHVAAGGVHKCEFCRNAREGRNILVPADEVLYVAPAMIVHYVTDHSYAPPSEFTAAVTACPPPATDAYYASLRRFIDVFSGGRGTTFYDFDRYAREHRERVTHRASVRAAEQTRKRFTWD